MVGDRHERYVTKEKVYKDDVIVKVLKQNRPLYMVEAQKAKKVTEKYSVPRFDAPIERFVVREQIYSSVAVPLISRNEKVGLLFINYRSHQQFEKEQKDAIELFASLAALVILNSRLEIANRKIKHIESKDSKDFIFISYVREDLDRVLPIYQKLIERGHKAWLDVEELLPGQDWDQEIQEIIKESKVFVACLSNRSVSKKGYFQKELKKGFDIYEEYPEGHIFMIPVILEECNIPTRFEKIQWCNLKNDDGFDKLFKAVEKSLGK
jgi:signal transduction protein with GAF and PtsI domain